MKKKNLVVIVAIVAMMCLGFAGVVVAGDASVDGDGNAVGLDLHNENNNSVSGINTQEQRQDQQQQQRQEQQATGGNASYTDSSRSVGRLPEVSTHGVGAAVIPMNEYGHLVTQMGFGPSLGCYEPMTMANFNVMVSVMEDVPGAQNWEDVNDKIIPDPIMRQRFVALGNDDPVFFFPSEAAVSVLSQLDDRHLVGLMVYNTELDKKRPVLVPYLKARANLDARRIGANVAIPVDQFFQGYFVPEGYEISVGGLLSWISHSLTNGGSVAGNAGMSKQQNTEFGRPGAAFIFLRVENPQDLCLPPPEQPVLVEEIPPGPEVCDPRPIIIRIEELKRKVVECKLHCFNNLGLRRALVEAYIDLYVCTGNREYLRDAIENAEIAERNYFRGHDIKANKAEADKIIAQVYYFWAGCINLLDGERAAMSFAESKHLERFPKGFK